MTILFSIETSDGLQLPPLTTEQVREIYEQLAEVLGEKRLSVSPPTPPIQPWLLTPYKVSTETLKARPMPDVVITCALSPRLSSPSGLAATQATQPDYSKVTLTGS